LTLLEERHISSAAAAEHRLFAKHGLTDCVVAVMAELPALVITDDLDLCAYLQSSGLDALNFNHLRSWA
jgi:hypothetical protein